MPHSDKTHWTAVGSVQDIPPMGARVLKTSQGDIALFRTKNDKVFALKDQCPHKGGALSQGIVHGEKVTCPLHNWVISLQKGEAQGFDTGCTPTYPIRQDGERLFIALENAITEESSIPVSA